MKFFDVKQGYLEKEKEKYWGWRGKTGFRDGIRDDMNSIN
jgi:hypothetical protein